MVEVSIETQSTIKGVTSGAPVLETRLCFFVFGSWLFCASLLACPGVADRSSFVVDERREGIETKTEGDERKRRGGTETTPFPDAAAVGSSERARKKAPIFFLNLLLLLFFLLLSPPKTPLRPFPPPPPPPPPHTHTQYNTDRPEGRRPHGRHRRGRHLLPRHRVQVHGRLHGLLLRLHLCAALVRGRLLDRVAPRQEDGRRARPGPLQRRVLDAVVLRGSRHVDPFGLPRDEDRDLRQRAHGPRGPQGHRAGVHDGVPRGRRDGIHARGSRPGGAVRAGVPAQGNLRGRLGRSLRGAHR